MRIRATATTHAEADGTVRRETPWFDPATGEAVPDPFTTPAGHNPRGLRLSVYRPADRWADIDTTCGGVTSQRAALTLIGYTTTAAPLPDAADPLPGLGEQTPVYALPPASQVMPATSDAPAVVLVIRDYRRALGMSAQVWAHLEPAVVLASGHLAMSGGNYAGTLDGRLGELLEQLTGTRFPILGVHDRVEV